jgi:enamine deaminase RidA (YjgF/YER057c/UK114 family)
MKVINPPGWPAPRGYSNGIAASGRFVIVAGQVGAHPDMTFESDDFVVQFRRALQNTVDILAAGGARPEHIARMTVYVTSKNEYLSNVAGVGAAWKELVGRHFPAMALIQVVALVDDRAKVEIETTAVVPD